MARYEISEDSFTAAVSKLVAAFQRENPSIGKFEATCRNGSKITIKFKTEPAAKKRAP